jgi:hypothetical protein
MSLDFTAPVEYKYLSQWYPARVLCFDRKGGTRCIGGLYERSGSEEFFSVDKEGRRSGDVKLRNAQKTAEKFWTVTYRRSDGTFQSRVKTTAPEQKVGDINNLYGTVVAIYEGTTENTN